MKIGILKETAPKERRVSMTPDGVARLVKSGFEVWIERGAGTAAFFADGSFAAVGAIVADAIDDADVVTAVRRPSPERSARLKPESVVIALLGNDGGDALDAMNNRRISVLSLERVPRITRAQSMDVLSSQATVAGYRSVLLAASHLPRFLPMLTTAAGSIPPARALVLGAGVAGLQAIATARRLGAIVSGFDIRSAAAEQVESLGAKFMAPEAVAGDAETSGGYAKELAGEQQRLVLKAVESAIAGVDMVIATAAIPGRPAPRLITREMLLAMKPGSVIIDVAAETGGNCELTRPGEVVVNGEVTVVGPLNLPSTMPQHASQMFGRNVQQLLAHLAPEGELILDLDDPITGPMCVAHGGSLRDGRTA